MISANPIDSKRRLRLTKGELSQIQRDMEFVARDLGLNEKNIYNKERQPNRKPEKAQQIEAVRGKVSNLEKTAQTVKEIVNLSCSHIDMEQRMMDQGYEIYKRGNTIGIKSLTDGRKYRFKRLDPELTDLYSKKIEQFNREKNREQNLRDKYRKMKEKSLERDVSRDMDMDI
jgi:cell shape-determining protein MreC